METEELRRFALIGARARLAEIDAERERLLAMFPELAARKYSKRGTIAKATAPEILFDAGEVKAKRGTARSKRGALPDKRPGKRRRIDEAFKADVIRRIKAGEYFTDVLRETGMNGSASAVSRWLKAAKVKITPMPMEERIRRRDGGKSAREPKPREGKGRGGYRKPADPAVREELLRRVAEGETASDAARAIGIKASTAHVWVARSTKGKT